MARSSLIRGSYPRAEDRAVSGLRQGIAAGTVIGQPFHSPVRHAELDYETPTLDETEFVQTLDEVENVGLAAGGRYDGRPADAIGASRLLGEGAPRQRQRTAEHHEKFSSGVHSACGRWS